MFRPAEEWRGVSVEWRGRGECVGVKWRGRGECVRSRTQAGQSGGRRSFWGCCTPDNGVQLFGDMIHA